MKFGKREGRLVFVADTGVVKVIRVNQLSINRYEGGTDLPSDLVHQSGERLLPPIHLYNADPRDDFIHCAYSVIC